MKLNKKGFGVAEIAIVILLIGILAAAVIVGFMGIKKNATEHVKEEATKSLEIIHQTKHAYPTILSSDLKNGLKIKEGEYEVYELGGYKISAGSSVDGAIYVEENATLFLSGTGTLDDTCKVAGSTRVKESAIVNEGNLTLSDLIVTGGTYTNKNSRYQISGYGKSETTLNNVKVVGANGTISVMDNAKVTINGTNTHITLPSGAAMSGGSLFYIALAGEVIVNDGWLELKDQHNQYFGLDLGGRVTINGGTIKADATCSSIFNIKERTYYGVFYDAIVKINGGIFDCAVRDALIVFNYNGSDENFEFKGNVTITGGEFIKEPPRFVWNQYSKANGVVVIKDAPNDGTDQLIFHFAPNAGSDGGWGQYVAEGYEWYKFDGQELWGVRPVGTP